MQRRRQLHFQRFGPLHQVHQRRGRGSAPCSTSAAACLKFGPRLNQVLVGFGIFHQRGRGADFAGQQIGGLGGQFGALGELVDKGRAGLSIHVPGGAVAASRSFWPRSRTSAMGCESRRETWVSRVRALTIWPSEVLVARGSR